jgi:Putative zinc-finger
MTMLTCTAVRRRLPAFYDRELPIPELIAIESHVSACEECAEELGDIQTLGSALRLAAAPGPADDWTGLQSGVISRMRAEAHESWAARTRRMFDDMHLVWVGLAAAVATVVCSSVALSAVHFASPERDDSLARMIEVISAPTGSDLNPVNAVQFLQVPSVRQRSTIEVMLAQPVSHDELMLALNLGVTRDGRVSGVSVLSTSEQRQPRDVNPILNALYHGRLEPGRVGAAPVAVNLVWLLAHTTVKAKAPRTT